MQVWPIDMVWAEDGYLRTPDGRMRHFLDLGRIMRIGAARGVRFYWSLLPPGCHGYCYCWRRVVLLSPQVIEWEPWRVRDCASHELGHALGGPSDALARRYQSGFHGDVIEPEPVL